MTNAPAFNSNDPDLGPPQQRLPGGTASLVLLLFILALGAYLGFRLLSGDVSDGRYGASHSSVGNSPARWQLEPLTGDAPPIDLEALQGKVTVVNFWGTWCPPCQQEFPHVVALWKRLKDHSDFRLAAVSCEPGIEKDIDKLRNTTADFLRDQRVDMPTYYDPQAMSRMSTMATTGEDLAFPATIIFGRDGTVRGYWRGYWPGMEKEIDALTTKLLAETK